MNNKANSIHRDLKQDDLIVVAGAGGFIGGSLVRYFHDLGYTRIRAVDKKPLSNWYQRIAGVENLCLDLSKSESCVRAVEGAVEVYNLAADMGGMGFIERFRVECMRSSLINTHMLEFMARFHNVYGPNGTWDGGREKAPAAICRKVIQAKDSGTNEIMIWGDGTQTRSFTYIEDCVRGIDMIVHCDELVATPINLGSSELISVDHLVGLAEEIGAVKLNRKYDLTAPRGVAGRNSDNTFIKQVFDWEPSTPFKEGLTNTYRWIEGQFYARKSGERVVEDTF